MANCKNDKISNMVKMIKCKNFHLEGDELVTNTLADLILRCELVILSSNSNHVEEDFKQACQLRIELNRNNVVLACLAGSFCHDSLSDVDFK